MFEKFGYNEYHLSRKFLWIKREPVYIHSI